MKMNKKLAQLMNEQVNHERFNEAFYWSCASYFDSLSLENIATYFKLHALEERSHAERFYNYLDENGERVIIDAVKAPERDFKSMTQAFELAVVAEEVTSEKIRAMSKLAADLEDHRAARFLREFELEQQEEEDLWTYNLSRAKLADGDKAATLIFDHEMAQREGNGNKKYKCMK